MNTQWIALVISLLGFLASVYYSNKNSKKTDIDDAVKRAELNTKISTKLDNIASDVRETSKNVDKLGKKSWNMEAGSRLWSSLLNQHITELISWKKVNKRRSGLW